jgi:putative nucleotidyltransferase with HDIG domain
MHAEPVKMRIIFVDDEPNILEGLQDLLRRYRRKWDMVFVSSGEKALEEIGKGHFDVVVSDMRMPGIDGAELLRRVQETRPHIVRIVLSGFAELEAALRVVPVAHQFLIKPTSAEVLENVIERACSLQALIQDDKIRGIVGKLQKLPSLPRIYAQLMNLLSHEQSSASEVAKVIEQDAAMCAKVLQMVNGSFFGQSRQITSIQGAVTYLGFNMIKNLSLSVGIFMLGGQSKAGGFSLERLQAHSMLVSALAMRILKTDKRQAEDAFMAGMLHDLGKMILGLELPQEHTLVTEKSQESNRPRHEVELEMFGVTHAEVGAYILGIWGLPYPVVEAVANHHAPERVLQQGLDILAAVHVANALSHEIASEAGDANEIFRPVDPEYLVSLGVADKIEGLKIMARTLWAESPFKG